jgi:hypothetical protein
METGCAMVGTNNFTNDHLQRRRRRRRRKGEDGVNLLQRIQKNGE